MTKYHIPLEELYGEDPNRVTFNDLRDDLATIAIGDDEYSIGIGNAKLFSRRLNLTYEELIEITRTQFINPHSHLIPKLEKLHVNFATMQTFINGTLSEADFEALMPEDLDQAAYGGDVKQWLRDNEAQIMGLIVLSDPTGREDICSFDTVELRYAQPDFDNNRLEPIEFLKLLRFIRLWRKLGWSIEQTDKMLAALFPAAKYPAVEDDLDAATTKLDDGFQELIPRLAHLQTVMGQLNLSPRRDLLPLLACWSHIDIHGRQSLYRQMFLNPTVLALDNVFQEDGYGRYLADKREYQQPEAEPPKLLAHAEALRAAFNLAQEEFNLICRELNFDENTALGLANTSAIFRHGFLARRLRLSVRELLALKALSGLDPFLPPGLAQPPDLIESPAIRFIEMAQQIKNAPFKVNQLAYLLRHEDWSGRASPSQGDILAFAQTLRNDLLRIEREYVIQDDPNGEIARAKMALVYGDNATDVFFGLLNNTSPFNVTYDHGQPALEDNILDVTARIAYDDFQKRLSFRGVMTVAEKEALDDAPSASDNFRVAVKALFDAGQKAFAVFFERYPDLKGLYENFVDSNSPVEDRMPALLADFLPDLRARLKRQQVRQTASAQVGVDLALVTPLLENASLLHAVGTPGDPAVEDFLTLETPGLSADIFFADDVTGDPDKPDILVNSIDYREGGDTLPTNPADDATISGVWRSFLEVPDNDFYNFYIEADTAEENITLKLDGEKMTLSFETGVWRNQEAIKLQAGRLYALELTAKQVRDKLALKWESKGMGRQPIPAQQLYPTTPVERYTTTYLRLLKSVAIAEALALSSAELEHFTTGNDYLIDGKGWLNALPVKLSSAGPTAQALFNNVLALLQYRTLKEELSIDDERLLDALQDPPAVSEEEVSLLERVTGWQEADYTALLSHFDLASENLTPLDRFVRFHNAFAVVKKLGIGATNLLNVITNEPDANRLRNLQGALRARYDDSPMVGATQLADSHMLPAKGALPISRDWLNLLQPINDELRSLQRDALVVYTLQRLGQDAATQHIDTPDKLFEYFLIDVEMDPCMKTSRIRQALSSVQLFIQRCLMNLEPQVASSSINAKQWEWMKRYRVWEANRKVFLWPENWLEPELRDNKSPFFKDLESELLQGDITDEAAATALVHYLEKLDEVAKLEICGMYYEENELGNEADDIVHVIARTAGARRTYYYRRQEGGTVWTPWEKIDLNIEDNPVLPVVWKGRLFLFWLGVLQETPLESNSSDNDMTMDLSNVKPSELRGVVGEPKIRVTVALYWSEYYHGKWQPARTSDMNRPAAIGDFLPSGSSAFDRTKLRLRSGGESSNQLHIFGAYPDKDGFYFTLYNTHSLPQKNSKDEQHRLRRVIQRSFSVDAPFTINYYNPHPSLERKVLLKSGGPYEIIEPRHRVSNIFEAPFIFQNQRHVFYVRTKENKVLVSKHWDYGVWTLRPSVIEPPPLVQLDFRWPQEDFFSTLDSVRPDIVDPNVPESFLRQHSHIRLAIGTAGTIEFGDRLIGPGGGITVETKHG